MSGFNVELAPVLVRVHNSFRFGGVNEPFQLDNGQYGEDGFGSDNFDSVYVLGLFTPLIIMTLFTIGWLISLCVTSCGCARESCCGNIIFAKFWFFLNTCLALLCFFISIKGTSKFNSGTSGGTIALINLATELIDSASLLQDISENTDNLQEDIDTTIANCPDVQEIVDSIPDINEVLDNLQFEDAIEFADDVDDEVSAIDEGADAYLRSASALINFFMTCIIIYLMIFLLVTCVAFETERVKRKGGKVDSNGWGASITICHRFCGCYCFAFCNLMFIGSMLSLALLSGLVGTFGADQCVPSAADDILVYVSGDLNPDRDELCNLESLEGDFDQEEVEYFTCHYLFCEGRNLLLDEIDVEEVRDENNDLIRLESEFFLQLLTDIDEAIQLANDAGEILCERSLLDLREEVVFLHDTSMEALEIVTCDTLTPIFRTVLDVNGCNEIVAGMCIIYICWLSGTIFLMLGMNAYYPVFDYHTVHRKKQHFSPMPTANENNNLNTAMVPIDSKVDDIPTATEVIQD